MAGKRVHQLAKELGMSSKELLDVLNSMGEDIHNPLASVNEDTQKALSKKLGKAKPAKPKAKKPAKKTKEAAKAVVKAPSKAKKGKTKAAPAAKKPTKAEASKKAAAPSRRPRVKEKEEAKVEKPPATAKPPQTEGRRVAERPRHGATKPTREKMARREPPRKQKPLVPREPGTKPMKKKLRIPAGITVRDFAQRLGKRPSEVLGVLMAMGEMININQSMSEDVLVLAADEMGVDIEVKKRVLEETPAFEDKPESLQRRSPVVTVMGHVDHGKTSLLDAIRKTSVIDKEMGGITQHIGASVIDHEGKTVTFIDTPGHESFTALRARGARVTDIAVLVVAADDGVMPQTVEAIDHAKAAEVPIMVAVNKIDKQESDPMRVRQQLTEFNLLPEEWGGETVYVDVSAKQGTNLDHLLEMILLLAEIQDLRANPDAPASGNIIEARLDKGRGPVATLLIKRGTLKRGDTLVAGRTYGRVRALLDDKGRMTERAGPSYPVEVLGLNMVPEAGDEFSVVEDERKARSIAEARTARERAEEERKPVRSISLDDLFKQIQEGQAQEFNLIIKADTQGSVEAVRDSVDRLKVGDIQVNVIHTGVGAITENDIMLAKASHAVVLGFNVRPDPNAQEVSEREEVDVRTYRVIYKLLEDLEAALKGMLEPEYEEIQVGLLEVRAVFKVPRQGIIAGALVKEGEINRNSQVRLVRDGSIVYEGSVSSLRRFKDDVRSVSTGYECGVGLENFQDLKEGDLIEVLEQREIPIEGEKANL
jgi:translation initiation factor IF-2